MTDLNWNAGTELDTERNTHLLKTARKNKMRVRYLGDNRFRVRGWSQSEKRIKDHFLEYIPTTDKVLCDCKWAQKRTDSPCRHSTVVRAYINRYWRAHGPGRIREATGGA